MDYDEVFKKRFKLNVKRFHWIDILPGHNNSIVTSTSWLLSISTARRKLSRRNCNDKSRQQKNCLHDDDVGLEVWEDMSESAGSTQVIYSWRWCYEVRVYYTFMGEYWDLVALSMIRIVKYTQIWTTDNLRSQFIVNIQSTPDLYYQVRLWNISENQWSYYRIIAIGSPLSHPNGKTSAKSKGQ